MIQQEAIFPKRALTYTPEVLSGEGEGALWEYYSSTNRLYVYGSPAYIKQVYGIDASYLEYDFDEYVTCFCDKSSQGTLKNDLKTAITNRTGYDNIHYILNPSLGTYRVIHACGNPRTIGQTVVLCGISQDITESVGLERTDILFAEAKKRVQVLLDASPTACIFCDEHFTVLDCNKRAIELFWCCSKQELLNRFHSFSLEYQPDGSNSWQKKLTMLRNAMESGREVMAWWYRLPNGEAMPAEVTLVRVPWDGSYCVASHIRDLRQLYASREKEREAEERYLTMLNANPLSCALWGRDLRLIDCNAATLQLFGITSKEEYLSNFFAFSPEYQSDGQPSKEQAIEHVKAVYEQEGYRQFEWIHRTVSGELFPAEITLIRVKWKDDYCVAAYIRDLRQFKIYLQEIEKTQEHLIAARNRAEQNARAKNEFLANISHEIRTPMNGIIGMTQLMLHGDMTDKQRAYIDTIDKSAKHLLRIINDILDFSKIDAGKMEFEQTEFSLQKLLGELVDSVMYNGNDIADKKLQVTLATDPAIPDTLIGDPLRLTQVLLNLFSNAIKFTRKGEIRLTIGLDEPPDEQTVKLRFSIADTGIGLTEEQIKGLFIPFSQADSSITRKYGGTGLGLAICKNIITLLGGSISCESTLGKGTAFTFLVCFGKASPQRLPAYHRTAGKRVFALIDEKTPYSIMLLHHQLLGCHVAVGTEKIAWEKDLSADIDFILISLADVRFRIKGVLETLSRRYGEHRPGILIIVSNREDQVFINALDSSCQVLYRPVTLSVLYSHLDDILSKTARKEPEPSDEEASIVAEIPDAIRGAYVLLVEDNEINQLMAGELLKMGGFKVDIASNGREAVEMVARNSYDIVLMDIQMPEMDGLTATRIIRQSANTIPILALTAHALAIDREKSLEAGMNDHITKPIDHTILFTAMARWVRPIHRTA